MQVVEGEVDLANEFGQVRLQAGESGEAEMGQAPHKTAAIETRNLLQWTLYYPAVLLPDELGLSDAEQQSLASSLAAYRQGDLLGALENFPRATAPDTTGGRLYRAAVLLATGRVEEARGATKEVASEHAGKRALDRMVAAVLGVEQPAVGEIRTGTLALAESYYQQSRRDLEAARAAARRATELEIGRAHV